MSLGVHKASFDTPQPYVSNPVPPLAGPQKLDTYSKSVVIPQSAPEFPITSVWKDASDILIEASEGIVPTEQAEVGKTVKIKAVFRIAETSLNNLKQNPETALLNFKDVLRDSDAPPTTINGKKKLLDASQWIDYNGERYLYQVAICSPLNNRYYLLKCTSQVTPEQKMAITFSLVEESLAKSILRQNNISVPDALYTPTHTCTWTLDLNKGTVTYALNIDMGGKFDSILRMANILGLDSIVNNSLLTYPTYTLNQKMKLDGKFTIGIENKDELLGENNTAQAAVFNP